VASYTWSDIDQDAYAATSQRLKGLQQRYPLLLSPGSTMGWEFRLPVDTRTISSKLFTHAFPARVDVINQASHDAATPAPRTKEGMTLSPSDDT